MGATAYVTLEPCNQRSGGSFACSQLLLGSGVARVVIACHDPHPLGAHGAERLIASGVIVEMGLMRAEAERLNAGFFKHVATGRPWLAIDGDASTYDGEFELARDETYEAALDRLGAKGWTRVFVRPGTALAAQLTARGLVDEDAAQGPANEKRAGHLADPFRSLLRCRRPRRRRRVRLEGLELRRGHFARALVLLELEAHALAFVEAGEASTLDSRDVDEHVRAAMLRLDEAEAFLLVEPFNSTGSHVDLVFR